MIVLATVGTDSVNMSPLTDFKLNFEHRQELKLVEDMVLDLQVILPGMLDSIIRVRDQCKDVSNSPCYSREENHEIAVIIGELNEYAREAKMHLERAKTLKEKAESTAHLVRCAFQV
jgi:hypothetical protein